MNSQYHKSLPDIHPDEIEYISSMLELPELDRLFWEIYYFLEFPHNSASIMELATQLIQVLEKCRLHYIKTYTYGEIKEDSSYTDILDYYINDYVFFPDIHFLLNAKNSVYYALTAYFTLNHSIYNLNKSSISEFEFLKQVIHLVFYLFF